jgi:3-dehydroquinate synthase
MSIKSIAVGGVTASTSVNVALGDRAYEIRIASEKLFEIGGAVVDWLNRRGMRCGPSRSACVITDANVENPHAQTVARSLQSAGWNVQAAVMPPGEQTKCLASTSKLYDALVDMKADRHTLVVAVGGGVIGDLAGFVAATYARGIPFVQVPTTLLAQVDSSVGGKVGINHPQGKNLIGAFYQPLGVFIDTTLLDTLPDREYRSGLAEVVKYGVILDAPFFDYLESHVAELNARHPETMRYIVQRSCRLKADVVEHDEFERTGLRAVLNYGHTFAHAFEALCGYGELLHGEAVAIGMACASRLAERLGRISGQITQRQTALLQNVGLPTRLPDRSKLKTDHLLDAMRLDKKTVGGKLRFVLPTRLGHVELVDGVDESIVRAVLDELLVV